MELANVLKFRLFYLFMTMEGCQYVLFQLERERELLEMCLFS